MSIALRAVVGCATLCSLLSCGAPAPKNLTANKLTYWADKHLGKGELTAGPKSIAAAFSSPHQGLGGQQIGTIGLDGTYVVNLPESFSISGNAGEAQYCRSGTDFFFSVGYRCYSQGTRSTTNNCTIGAEAKAYNIRLGAHSTEDGNDYQVLTAATLVKDDSQPYAIVTLDGPTSIDGCLECQYFDEDIGTTSAELTNVCFSGKNLPANKLLGVFRTAASHLRSERLNVTIRPLVASDLTYLRIQ